MRYKKRHTQIAATLARRKLGVTARELAVRAKISRPLANTIISDLAKLDGYKRVRLKRDESIPGPPPLALVAE